MPYCREVHARVATVSDSILADGGMWSGFAREGRDARFSFPAHMDRAVGGATSQALLDGLDAVIALSPDLLVVHAGTNDLVATIEPAHAIYTRLVALSTRCLAGGIGHVVLLCVLPRQDVHWKTTGFRHRVRRQLNAMLRRMPRDTALAAYKGRVSIVDLETCFDPLLDTVDGLHPNRTGAEKIGQAVGLQLDRVALQARPVNRLDVRGALAYAMRFGLSRLRGYSLI